MIDLYGALGLERTASDKEIHKAYRKLAKEHHPDMPDGDRKKFELVTKAHLVLMDPNKRAHYDKTGFIDDRPPSNAEAEVNGTLMEVFMTILNQATDPERIDIVHHMNGALSQAVEQISLQDKVQAREIKRLEKVKERLSVKKGTPNVLHQMIGQQIGAAQGVVAQNAHKRDVMEKCIQVLKDYKYKVDEGRPSQQLNSMFRTWS